MDDGKLINVADHKFLLQEKNCSTWYIHWKKNKNKKLQYHGGMAGTKMSKLPNTKNKTGTSETNETSIIAIVLTLGIQSK